MSWSGCRLAEALAGRSPRLGGAASPSQLQTAELSSQSRVAFFNID